VSRWLDTTLKDPRGRAIASGFGVVFEMMLAATDAADLNFIRHHDQEWATTLPSTDFDRFDDLSDLAVAANSTVIAESDSGTERADHPVRDGLRILRAVYRFGLLAWILDGSRREGGSPQRLAAARWFAQHFRDRSILTFVAGRAIEVSGDQRIAWWQLMMQPRAGDRVVTMSFIPALITAYLSLLMDLLPLEPIADDLDLPAEPWLEEYNVMLLDGIAGAWPLQADPSFWQGRDDRTRVEQDQRVGDQRRRLALAIESVVDDLQQARAIRIRRAAISPVKRELFIVTAARAWATHRTLGRALHALGAPHSAAAAPTVELLRSTVPKAGFVGEGSDIHVESYGEQAGRQAAVSETTRVLGMLEESLGPSEERQTVERRALAERVINAIRGLREADYDPSLVLTPSTHAIWSRLAVDTTELTRGRERLRNAGVPEYLLRFVRAAIEGVIVISLPAFDASNILVIDAHRALAVPAEFDPSGEDLEIALLERTPAELESELVSGEPDISDERLAALLEEQLQQLVVTASAKLAYEIADPDAMSMIRI
jgi:hypothetical protein